MDLGFLAFGAVVVACLAVLVIFVFKHFTNNEGRTSGYREHSAQEGTEKEDNPWIPNFIEGKPARIVLLVV